MASRKKKAVDHRRMYLRKGGRGRNDAPFLRMGIFLEHLFHSFSRTCLSSEGIWQLRGHCSCIFHWESDSLLNLPWKGKELLSEVGGPGYCTTTFFPPLKSSNLFKGETGRFCQVGHSCISPQIGGRVRGKYNTLCEWLQDTCQIA